MKRSSRRGPPPANRGFQRETVGIQYETADGTWHEEVDPGTDRPETAVKD
jgi:hypothetical protein